MKEEKNTSADMAEFEKLIDKVAEMPEAEREKIAFFVNGYVAAKNIEKDTATA